VRSSKKYFLFILLIIQIFAGWSPVFADPESVQEADELIYEGINKNKEKIRQLAWNLSDEERRKLIFKYRRDEVIPVALNVLLGFGIGSYLQGDLLGGITGSALGVVFFTSLSVGIILFSNTGFSDVNSGAGPWFIAAGISGVSYAAFEVLRPIGYARKFNNVLYDVLKIKERIAINLLPYRRTDFYSRRTDEGAMLAFTSFF
jgi:hypothetical protein